jgi:oxygen-independent coproporphyrinogen-3 oxidase
MTERSPERWLDQVERTGTGIVETETLSPAARTDEMMLMGLRLSEGIDLARLASLGRLAPRKSVVDALIAQGFMEWVDPPRDPESGGPVPCHGKAPPARPRRPHPRHALRTLHPQPARTGAVRELRTARPAVKLMTQAPVRTPATFAPDGALPIGAILL